MHATHAQGSFRNWLLVTGLLGAVLFAPPVAPAAKTRAARQPGGKGLVKDRPVGRKIMSA